MIGVIFGEKGTGKTKHILELANKSSQEAKGSIVFIDSDNSYMYDVSNRIRFINTAEYGIHTPKMLFGFLSGIAAMDFDLEKIYIDGFIKITHHDLESLEGLFNQLTAFTEKHHIDIIMSVSGNTREIPEFVKDKLLETV